MCKDITEKGAGFDRQTEKDLLKRVLADKEAFGTLYDYYYPRLYNYIIARVGEAVTAEDLASDIFEKAFGKLSSYDHSRGRFSTWLFSIANNAVRDYFRLRAKYTALPLESEAATAADSENPLTKVVEMDMKRCLLKAVQSLKDRAQNIVGLKFWGGLTNRQIAQMLEMNESTVSVVLFRSMKHLRAFLQENNCFETSGPEPIP